MENKKKVSWSFKWREVQQPFIKHFVFIQALKKKKSQNLVQQLHREAQESGKSWVDCMFKSNRKFRVCNIFNHLKIFLTLTQPPVDFQSCLLLTYTQMNLLCTIRGVFIDVHSRCKRDSDNSCITHQWKEWSFLCRKEKPMFCFVFFLINTEGYITGTFMWFTLSEKVWGSN